MADAINTFNEKSLHADLKAWYAGPDGEMEVPVDGYIVDAVRDGWLIEVQTQGFSAIKGKLATLSESYRVLLVYPIPREKWLVKAPKPNAPDAAPTRRKSPKRGNLLELFWELVSLPDLVARPSFEVEVAWTLEEELRSYDRRRGWRRNGWVIDERRLLDVVECRRFATPQDFTALLPGTLPAQFTTADLAKAGDCSRRLAQKMAYCLREMGQIDAIGHRRRSVLYTRAS